MTIFNVVISAVIWFALMCGIKNVLIDKKVVDNEIGSKGYYVVIVSTTGNIRYCK